MCRISLYTNCSAPPVLNARFKFYKRRQLSSARTMIFMMRCSTSTTPSNSPRTGVSPFAVPRTQSTFQPLTQCDDSRLRCGGQCDRNARAEGRFQKRMVALTLFSGKSTPNSGMPECVPLPSVLAELLAQPAAESTASRSSITLIVTRVLLRSRRRFSSAEKAHGSRAN